VVFAWIVFQSRYRRHQVNAQVMVFSETQSDLRTNASNHRVLRKSGSAPQAGEGTQEMKLADISERAEQRPFRSFVIETTGGGLIEIEKESDILLPPRRPDLVIVFNSSGRMWILGVDQIASLEAK
jgi:hypothetical protein